MKTETTKKWQCCPNNPPGKIQLNRVREALRDLGNEHYTSIEKSGIIGKTDGYDAESSYAVQRWSIGGENTVRPEVTAAQDAIGEKHGWIVSRDNAKTIVEDVAAAMPALKDSRPVNDERQTQEQADAAKEQRIAENQASQAREQAAADALRLVMETEFGIIGRTVSLSPGEKAIVAVLCFDNSHYQSDYFDNHARLGVPLLVGVTKSSREDESTARRAMERFALLAALKFEWKTEKYSMGHGNYLTSEAVDVPPSLAATRQAYGGGEIKRGHWEIQYRSARQEGENFSVFAGYYDVPTQPEADEARQTQGGALGTVARNHVHNGVEIAFNEKPSDELRWKLKRAGFRITRRPPWRWYQKFSESAWHKAVELAGVNPSENVATGGDEPDHFDMQVEDQMAEAAGVGGYGPRD